MKKKKKRADPSQTKFSQSKFSLTPFGWFVAGRFSAPKKIKIEPIKQEPVSLPVLPQLPQFLQQQYNLPVKMETKLPLPTIGFHLGPPLPSVNENIIPSQSKSTPRRRGR